MKPLKLQLKNFGPFLDETIDFSRIQSNQLFLISGKTGSGKTMIFDGIVYALYGRASTEKREVKHLRSHFATATEPLTVIFEFEVHHRRYKVIREASFLKPGNKNETKPKLEVYRFENNAYVLLESTIQAGERFILELLKLKQNQFRQLFVLPQGEFKEFLVSNSTDKQTILRTLFNTQLYDTLKNRLTDKTKNMKSEIDQRYTKIQSAWDELYTLDHESLQAEKGLQSEQYDLMIAALPKFKEIAQQQVLEAEKQKESAEHALMTVTEALNRQKLRLQLMNQHEELNHQLEQLQLQKPEILQLETQLKLMNDSKVALKMTQDLQEVEQAYQVKQQAFQALQNDKERLEVQQREQQQKLEQHLLVEDEIVTQERFIERTRHYYNESDQLIEKHERLSEIEKEREQIQHLQSAGKKALQKIDAADIERHPDYERKSSLQSQQIALTEHIAHLRDAQKQSVQKQQLHQQSDKLKEKCRQLDVEMTQLKNKIQVISTSEQQLIDHEQAVVTLRAVMQESEPCPVCGQTVHHVESNVQIERIKTILHENQQIEQQISALKEQKIKYESELHHVSQRLVEIGEVEFEETSLTTALDEQQKIKVAIEKVDAENERIVKIQREVERIQQSMNDNKQKLALLEQEQTYITEQLHAFVTETDFEEIAAFQRAFKAAKKSVDTFRDTLKTYTEQCEQTAQSYKEIQYKITLADSQLDDMSQQIESLHVDIDAALTELNIPNRAALNDILKESEHKAAYEEKVNAFRQKLQTVELKMKDISQQISDIQPANIEKLSEEEAAQREKLQACQKLYNESAFQMEQNEHIAQRLTTEVHDLKATLSEQLALFQLAEILNGKNAHHLTLENYVLMHYLEQILVKANQRLLNMTGQRYELVRNDKKGRGFSGLEIEVYDYYSNQSRHITSLSGGETFQASLALALGLSEVVQSEQGGIALDAMFIDEGFGTLDQETLETALDTLIQLQSSGRLVGIISHVSELKNRIPVILEVVSKNYQSTTYLRSHE